MPANRTRILYGRHHLSNGCMQLLKMPKCTHGLRELTDLEEEKTKQKNPAVETVV